MRGQSINSQFQHDALNDILGTRYLLSDDICGVVVDILFYVYTIIYNYSFY